MLPGRRGGASSTGGLTPRACLLALSVGTGWYVCTSVVEKHPPEPGFVPASGAAARALVLRAKRKRGGGSPAKQPWARTAHGFRPGERESRLSLRALRREPIQSRSRNRIEATNAWSGAALSSCLGVACALPRGTARYLLADGVPVGSTGYIMSSRRRKRRKAMRERDKTVQQLDIQPRWLMANRALPFSL